MVDVTAASHSVSALDLPLDLIAFQEHLLPALGVWSFGCLYKQRFPPCRYVYKTLLNRKEQDGIETGDSTCPFKGSRDILLYATVTETILGV